MLTQSANERVTDLSREDQAERDRSGGCGRVGCRWAQRAGGSLVLALCAALTGCASSKWFDNIPACGLDGKQAYVVSMWGRIGIASPLTQAEKVCK